MSENITGYSGGVNSAKKRKKEKIKKQRLYVITIILVALAICILLAFNVFFNIQNVEISGSTNYTSEEIFLASKITVGDNMLRENTDECSKNITSELIYIETAEVKKSYPCTIKIRVSSSVPTANVQTNSGYLLISQGGKVLETLRNPKSGLMNIIGSDPDASLRQGDRFISIDEKKTENLYALLEAFDENDMTGVTDINITDITNVSFVYDSRITVEMGATGDLDYKLKFVNEILSNQIGSGVFGTLRLLHDGNGQLKYSRYSAQFIDEAGELENNRIYESNMSAYESSVSESESISISESESLSESVAEESRWLSEHASEEETREEHSEDTSAVTEAPPETEESMTETAATMME